MNWKEFLKSGVAVVAELDNTELTGAEKLEKLTEKVAAFLENVDDLVEFLPLGLGWVAKILLDNGITDSLQREYAAKPLAEMLYQSWYTAQESGGDVAEFARGAPVPAL